MFTSCKKLKSVTFSSRVEVIGEDAFSGCGLTSVTIPVSVKKINGGAFLLNPLKTITIKSTQITKMGEGAFGQYYANNPITVVVPKSKLASYKKMMKKTYIYTIYNKKTGKYEDTRKNVTFKTF